MNTKIKMSLCYICEEEITDDDEFSSCDSCDCVFHHKCANVRVKDKDARLRSNCLRLFCPECFKEKSNGTFEKLKEIAKILYKIDHFNQEQIVKQQKSDDVIASLTQQIISLESKIDSLGNGRDANKTMTKTNTHLDTVKRSDIKPAVVIRPKNKQQSSQTLSDITGKVGKSTVNVCGTRNVRDGGIVLRCDNSTETMKVKQLVVDSLGDDYEVTLPKIKLPRLRISNIDPEIKNDEILSELKSHNPTINNMNMRVITVLSRKYRDSSYNEIVIEVNSVDYKQLIDMKKLRLPWRECRIFEHLYLVRCYKCCGFQHKSNDCQQNQKCGSGSHKSIDCKSKRKCCINCKAANDKNKMNIDVNHHAWSKQCPILKRHLSKLAQRIEYNATE